MVKGCCEFIGIGTLNCFEIRQLLQLGKPIIMEFGHHLGHILIITKEWSGALKLIMYIVMTKEKNDSQKNLGTRTII